MKLLTLIQNLDYIKSNKPIQDIEIKNVHCNSKEIAKNGLFVAIKGYLSNGHNYIKNAKDNGAVVAIVEDFIEEDILQIQVKNTRIALSQLSSAYYYFPSEKLSIIGITATNGKTTTSYMLKEIYEQAKIDTAIIGTVKVQYQDYVIPSILTTPESVDLQKHLAYFEKHHAQKVIMEVSSSAQELHRVHDVSFDIVSFHNLSSEHLKEHGSFERYVEMKSKLITTATPNQKAVINVDNPLLKQLISKTKAEVFTYSMHHQDADFSIRNLDLSSGRGKFDLWINKKGLVENSSYHFELKTAGYANVMNAIDAIIIAILDNIPIETIQKALSQFKGVERRFEIIFDKDYCIIDDHFANQVNIEATLSTIDKMTKNKLHIVYALRGNRGMDITKESCEALLKWKEKLNIQHLYATLSQDVVTSKDEVSKEEQQCFMQIMKDNNIEVTIENKLSDILLKAIKMADKEDIILLAGCQGMDKAARIILPYLAKQYNDLTILSILENRTV